MSTYSVVEYRSMILSGIFAAILGAYLGSIGILPQTVILILLAAFTTVSAMALRACRGTRLPKILAILSVLLVAVLIATPATKAEGPWFLWSSPTAADLNDVYMVSPSKGWIVGDVFSGVPTLLVWFPPEREWRNVLAGFLPVTITEDLNAIHCFNADNCWVSGNADAAEVELMRTKNGGVTWEDVSAIAAPDPLPLFDSRDIQMVTLDRIVVVGTGGEILICDNAATPACSTPDSGTVSDLNAVQFVDPLKGWAVGNGGTIIRTEDGGITWTSQASGVTEDLFDIFMLDENFGFVVGQDDTTPLPDPDDTLTILQTMDGGSTWVRLQAPASVPGFVAKDLFAIWLKSASEGWTVGEDGITLKWDGSKWVDQTGTSPAANQAGSPDLVSVMLFGSPETDGFAVGASGTIMRLSITTVAQTVTQTVTQTQTTTVLSAVTQTSTAIQTEFTTVTSTTVAFTTFPGPAIPGFPWESILIGLGLGLLAITVLRRRRIQSQSRSEETS